MLNKEKEDRYQVEFYCIDDLVPKNHLLRKIEKAVDFKKIYELTDELYCKDNGRPNVDSVVLFKMVLIQHLYGLNSLRRTHEEIQMNIAYTSNSFIINTLKYLQGICPQQVDGTLATDLQSTQ